MLWTEKNVLITGGTGTVGKALLKKLLSLGVKRVYLFSRDEQKQDLLMKELKDCRDISFIIGDIRNPESLNSAMAGIDVVFHTAAMKIVRVSELNPYETFRTNISGTQNVISAAMANKVEKVIFTSSDKASGPTSVMGVSKLFGERLVSLASFHPNSQTVFSSVRFGNVLGSRGCVLDLFKNQIMSQDYVTVTHDKMSRFILSIDSAADFLIKCAEISKGGEVFIDKMPSIRIYDLAEVLIDHLAPLFSKKPEEIKIRITEKQIVEKLYEEIITEHEAERAFDFNDYYCILPSFDKESWDCYETDKATKVSSQITSDNAGGYISKDDLLDFLMRNKLL